MYFLAGQQQFQIDEQKSLEAHGRVCMGDDEGETNSEPKSKSTIIHPCSKCGKTFSSKSWSARHSARYILNNSTHKCDHSTMFLMVTIGHYSLPKSFRNVPYLLPHRCDGVRIRAPIWRRGGQGGLEYVCAVEGCSSNGAAFSKMYEIWFINVQFSMSIIMLDWLLLGTVWGRTSTQIMSMKTKRWEVS